MLRILRNTDYPSRPWKNGGGTTRDILVSPAGASLGDFDWRVSLAQVDRDGPFSRFDDVDRTLVLLSGAMTLHEPDRRIELVRNEPVRFPGERAIQATVLGGATLDFNVMTRRSRATHTVTNDLLGERVTIEVHDHEALIVFALEPGVAVDDEPLDVHDTAFIAGQRAVMTAPTARAAALVVRIVDFRPNVL
jgi:hypothetical protein